MRGAVVGFLAVLVVVAFSSAGCSHRSKKAKKEPLQITTTSLPDGYEGQTGYSAQLTATGGTGSYTWSISGQPSWLSIDATTGELIGTPPTGSAGTYNFTVEVTDGQQTVQANLTITVYAQLQITTTSLPDGYDGQTGYSATLTATGGTGTCTWNISSGSLPPSLNFDSSTGLISGDIASNASTNSPYTFTVEVTDGQQTAHASLSITVYEELQITTASLPDAIEGVAYSYTLTASGGSSSNHSWSISGQPPWLSIDATTGELSGTPPAGSAGTYIFTIEATDGQQTASRQFDLTVNTPLVVDFEASPTQGTAPLTVNFTDKSIGNPTSWEWDFDNDGTPDSTQQNPTYTYNNPGWYTVKLTVSDGTNSNTCVKEMFVLVASSIYYVDGVNGDDGNGGTGWSDAFATIGKALSVADDYDLVLVADATYNETDLNFNAKKIHLKGVAYNTAGERPVIDCQQAGRAFCFSSGETKDCVVDNFTIRNGSADFGGAILCSSSGPSITNCIFRGNSVTGVSSCGGAIYCYSSSASIANCTFINNSARGSFPLGHGGAIYCESSSPSITNCVFSGNSATMRGGAVSCHTNSSPTVTNCIFSGNKASGFSGSTSGHGGAIYCDSSSPSITNCVFRGNSANDYGGAICCEDSSNLIITNCAFSGNSGPWGAAVYCCGSSSPSITNCIFSRNSTRCYGGAVCCHHSSSPILNNCILWGDSARNSGDEIHIYDSGSSCTLNYCCVDNTGYGGHTGNIAENNCIYDDPQFVDAANGDYHLKDTSPCIDAGDNTLVPGGVNEDLDGNQRVVDGDNDGTDVVDIGAYEYQPSIQPLKITTTTLLDAAEGTAYSCTVTATGGNPANYNWSASGQPSWLSIDAATGELSGTPPSGSTGTYTFTVEVTDGQQTASKQFSLTVMPAGSLIITTATLPEGKVGVAYPATTLTATGGTAPYTWADVNNTLQAYGLTLGSSTGEISGTPTQATPTGGVTVTIEVTDSNNNAAQRNLTLVIYPELQITTTSLPYGYEGQVGYFVRLTATGGTGTYTWSITSGTLPANLSWDAAGATIGGDIATGTAGDYPLQFEITDGIQTVTVDLTLTVRAQLQITATSLPDATEGAAYSYTIQATGGTTPYAWSVSGLPTGLTWSQVGDQVRISGTPAAGTAGTYNVDVTVSDSSSPTQSVSATLQLVVNSAGGGTTLIADFEASPTQGTAPLTVNFTDKSTGNPTSWEWDFDNDGTVDSTQQNPTYTYNNPGWYTVKLTVSDGTNSNTCVKEMFVLVASSIYYVDGVNGNDWNGGTGWSDAFATIGKALDVASDYDLVLVADATYNETDLNFNGKKIYLKGVDHNTAGGRPVIDCQQAGRAFHFSSGETKDAVIENFVVQNGQVTGGGVKGGAIYCSSSSPTITNCAFSGNSAIGSYAGGGAIYCSSSSPMVTNCTFSGNSASGGGGAIYCYYHGSPTVINCVFSGNSADYGGAFVCGSNSRPTLTNCTFSGNSASSYGGVVRCWGASRPTLNNCILWNNTASSGGNEIYINDSASSCTLNYCCVDNAGYGGQTGKITENNCVFADPQFVDPANGDYHLQDTSPCIDAGDNSLVRGSVDKDLDGKPRIVNGTVDIGAYEKQ